MKRCIIIGNLGANATRRTAADGTELMTFSMAISRGREKDPLWVDVAGRYRERLFPLLVKGQQVAVAGTFDVYVWNGRPDFSVHPDHIELCGAPRESQPTDTQGVEAEADIY